MLNTDNLVWNSCVGPILRRLLANIWVPILEFSPFQKIALTAVFLREIIFQKWWKFKIVATPYPTGTSTYVRTIEHVALFNLWRISGISISDFYTPVQNRPETLVQDFPLHGEVGGGAILRDLQDREGLLHVHVLHQLLVRAPRKKSIHSWKKKWH